MMPYWFHYPFVFLLLLPVWWVLWVLFSRRKQRSFEFSWFEELKKVFRSDSLSYKYYFSLITLAFLLFICLLASPYKRFTEETVEKNGIDIEILFDISYSMTATDLKPSRIDVAKQVFSDFVDGLTSDRVGMIVFAGRPFTSFPLTFDYNFIKEYLKTLTVDTINQWVSGLQWTAIGDAIILGESAFWKEENRQKIMILLTDGEANRWMNPISAIKYLKDKNIKAYTIWVGKTEKTFVTATDIFWNPQKVEVWGVDEESLKEIANQTWGKYYRATSSDALKQIIAEIGKLEKTKIEAKKTMYEHPYETPFLWLLLLVLWGIGILSFRKVKL